MFSWIIKKIIGSKNERELKNLTPTIQQINDIEKEYQTYSDTQIRSLTEDFKKRLNEGASLDDIMCEAFAAAKNVGMAMLAHKLVKEPIKSISGRSF